MTEDMRICTMTSLETTCPAYDFSRTLDYNGEMQKQDPDHMSSCQTILENK